MTIKSVKKAFFRSCCGGKMLKVKGSRSSVDGWEKEAKFNAFFCPRCGNVETDCPLTGLEREEVAQAMRKSAGID